ncbi:ATP-binding protein [Massilia sp. Root335]|uniref:hybrid sensor histidine kinase/response regulator n=1 Tax=Massilia sp. Root335 TaxID=1736517 RepID=UPI0006FF1A64|nr:ATP-binding protein [Massilia sp. Root335]KQV36107.1 diguanylate cyclase [Massilia sp. Root335]
MADILRTTAGLGGESEVRRLLREHDWTTSPLGPPEGWPPELATAVSMAVSSAFPMFIAWGPDLRFLYNDAYVPILGDKHPAAFDAPFQQAWSEIWPDLVPIVDRALSNKSAYFEDLPLTMERKGFREQTWFTFSYSPLHDGNGRVAGLYCTVIETTGRVQAERRAAFELAVADALRPLASADDAIRTGCTLLGLELGMARVLYGEVDDNLDTLSVARDWHRPGLAAVAGHTFAIDAFGPELGRAGRTGETVLLTDVRTDLRAATRQGTYLALDIHACLAVPLRRDGRLQAFLVLGLDRPHAWTDAEVALARGTAERIRAAVDLARAQTTLREERDRSRTILDTIAEGFLLLDRSWTVLQMNPAGLRIARMDAGDIIGRNHWDVWPEAIDSEAGRMYRRVMRDRVAGTAEYRQRTADGVEIWCEVRAYPTADGGLVSFFRDVTERKAAEDKLRAADSRKDEFLAMLAHELRNPLAPISAAADLLRIGRLDENRVRQSSAIIGRQVRHMTSLVDDLLDVSRVTRGLVTLARAPVAARTIVDEAIEQVRPMFETRRQHLAVDIADPDAMVLGDKARLVQVLANLLNNAAKYTPEGRRIEVTAVVARARGRLLLTVRDEGIGMEPELTGHVFDLFTQAQRSVDRAQGGLGLGLALVKNLVELHGGTVACTSAGLGQGSTFEVALPLMESATRAAPAAAAPGAQAGTADARRPLRLLVVDDNVDAAATLGMLLEACGYLVDVEHESHRALERARQQRPDVALLDIGLPDMDGNELARRLRADAQTGAIVLVAVTGYGQEQDRRAAFEAGFDHHLVKPVDMDELAALLAGIEAERE